LADEDERLNAPRVMQLKQEAREERLLAALERMIEMQAGSAPKADQCVRYEKSSIDHEHERLHETLKHQIDSAKVAKKLGVGEYQDLVKKLREKILAYPHASVCRKCQKRLAALSALDGLTEKVSK
jgi:dTDP-D-glucose 4,6-dehydratase